MSKSKREEDAARHDRPKSGANPKIVVAFIVATIAVIAVVSLLGNDKAPSDYDTNFVSFGLLDDPYLGSPDAQYVLVGYESPHCSSCKLFHNNILPTLKSKYLETGDVAYYYIQGTIGGDLSSNIAQECAYQEGGNEAFWAVTDQLYNRANTYTAPDWDTWLSDLAAAYSLDKEALLECYRTNATEDRVRDDWAVGSDMNARGTPSFWAFGPQGEAVAIGSMNEVDNELTKLIYG